MRQRSWMMTARPAAQRPNPGVPYRYSYDLLEREGERWPVLDTNISSMLLDRFRYWIGRRHRISINVGGAYLPVRTPLPSLGDCARQL